MYARTATARTYGFSLSDTGRRSCAALLLSPRQFRYESVTKDGVCACVRSLVRSCEKAMFVSADTQPSATARVAHVTRDRKSPQFSRLSSHNIIYCIVFRNSNFQTPSTQVTSLYYHLSDLGDYIITLPFIAWKNIHLLTIWCIIYYYIYNYRALIFFIVQYI